MNYTYKLILLLALGIISSMPQSASAAEELQVQAEELNNATRKEKYKLRILPAIALGIKSKDVKEKDLLEAEGEYRLSHRQRCNAYAFFLDRLNATPEHERGLHDLEELAGDFLQSCRSSLPANIERKYKFDSCSFSIKPADLSQEELDIASAAASRLENQREKVREMLSLHRQGNPEDPQT